MDEEIKGRFERWPILSPVLMVSFGVARSFPHEPPLNFHLLKTPLQVGGEDISGFSLRLFNYSERFAPSGKTVIQAALRTDWKFWNELQQDRPRYEHEKQRVAAEILSRLEALYPGLSPQVEVTDVMTPYTTWRYTLNHQGAFMGWLPTPKALRTNLPKTLPSLSNFYMAGQWVAPGGGVPPCLYSGRHVIQMLCRRDGKRFSTTEP